VTLDNSFETLTGTVESISGSNIVQTGNSIVRNVTVNVKNPGGLSSSQAATVSIAGINCAASGTFQFRTDSTVTASVAGTVTAVNAREGSSVSRNQTIVTLGGSTLEDQIQSAKDQLSNANLSMESTQDQLDNYTITSPIAGTIVDKEYKAGDKVESGTTLCTIYDLSYLEMTMNIDELDISKVSVGQSVSVTADAVEGKTYTGTITKVSVAGTTTNGTTTYPVTVRIDETDGLLPGMNVDAEIIISEADNVLAIPAPPSTAAAPCW
jgi:HlyD family secretion protein